MEMAVGVREGRVKPEPMRLNDVDRTEVMARLTEMGLIRDDLARYGRTRVSRVFGP